MAQTNEYPGQFEATQPAMPPPAAPPQTAAGQPASMPVQQQPSTTIQQPVAPQQQWPAQPVPAPAQQSVPILSSPPPPALPPATGEMILYSHSSLFYWWPVWAMGYVMAAITYFGGERALIGDRVVWFYPSSNLGIIYFLTVFMVILITNVVVRGLTSVIVILCAILVTLTMAFFGLWDPFLSLFGDLTIQLDLGAYFWFSTLMFLVWVFTVFVFDRMTYWRFTPGQVLHEYVLGASVKAYDTENLVLEKHRDDVFRHWVLGLGSGDLVIRPYGAEREEFQVPNVLFIGPQIEKVQRLIATSPTS